MASFEGSGFEKQRSCPSPGMMLSYHRSNLPPSQTRQVADHIATCDFCAAELQLLKNHFVAEELWEPAALPPHLSALAAALLRKGLQTASLSELFERTAGP